MPTERDDSERLRAALGLADDAATRPPGTAGGGAPCVVAKIASGSTASAFWTLTAQTVMGTEADGSAGTLTSAGWTLKALNLGSTAPSVGTAFLCTFVNYRWVFRN